MYFAVFWDFVTIEVHCVSVFRGDVYMFTHTYSQKSHTSRKIEASAITRLTVQRRHLFFFFFFNFLPYHLFLHRLENRTKPISTPYDGRRWWDSNLRTPACKSPVLPLCYGRRRRHLVSDLLICCSRDECRLMSLLILCVVKPQSWYSTVCCYCCSSTAIPFSQGENLNLERQRFT